MDDFETDRASQRANLIEQRMFELTLTSLDTLKHAAAVDLRKAQNEMKKRLRQYRDRQRDIVRSRPASDKDPIEELISRQMRSKAKKKRPKRPMTCPPKLQTSKSSGTNDKDSDSDVEVDGTFMIDHQRSKIDLRPKTAMDICRRGCTLDKYVDAGRLGPPVRQIRYFDEDELKDRGHFYMHLVNKRIKEEKSKLNSLDDKVAEFCGAETIQTMNKKIQSKRKWFTRGKERADSANLAATRTTTPRAGASRRTNQMASKGTLERIRPKTSTGREVTRPQTAIQVTYGGGPLNAQG